MKRIVEYWPSFGYVVRIKTVNQVDVLFDLSSYGFSSLRCKKESSDARLIVYPVGDFNKLLEHLALQHFPGSIAPDYIKSTALSTPIGIVLELIHKETGEMVRSMPIPWEIFEKAEQNKEAVCC